MLISPLTPDLIEAADGILMAAFGKPERRVADLRRYLELQPDGYFAAWEDERLAGIGGAIDYGAMAYVGMVAVHPDCQRRGIARRLMAHVLEQLKARGTAAVWLDASAKGYPLYCDMGFIEVEESSAYRQIEAVITPPAPATVRRMTMADLPELAALDTPIFGADRSRLFRILLRDFPDRAFVTLDETERIAGYLFARGRHVGPWVAREGQDAEALLQAALTLPMDGAPAFVMPAANRQAAEMLGRYGFQRISACRHMRLGEARVPERRDLVYAQTSYAIG